MWLIWLRRLRLRKDGNSESLKCILNTIKYVFWESSRPLMVKVLISKSRILVWRCRFLVLKRNLSCNWCNDSSNILARYHYSPRYGHRSRCADFHTAMDFGSVSGIQVYQELDETTRTLAVFNSTVVIILYNYWCLRNELELYFHAITGWWNRGRACFKSCSLSETQRMYRRAILLVWELLLSSEHWVISTLSFCQILLLRTDYRGLKFVFDMSKTTIPALQRYELITDGY